MNFLWYCGESRDLTIQEEKNKKSEISDSAKKESGPTFKFLMSELLRKKPEVSRDEVLKLIEEKKSKVGGGYLTDQGALFLVGSDLGVSLRIDEAMPALSDLEAGQSNVSFIARIFSLGPPRKFTRKLDSSAGCVSKLVLYDASTFVTLSVWDAVIMRELLAQGAGPGSAVRVSNSYTKPDLDGSPAVNLSKGGKIEKLMDSEPIALGIPKLESKIGYPQRSTNVPLIIKARIRGEARRSDYTKKNGAPGTLVTLGVMPEGIEGETRVVLWNNLNPVFETLKDGQTVTFVNLKERASDFGGSKSTEFHGDETTLILENWKEGGDRKWLDGLLSALEQGEAKGELAGKSPALQSSSLVLIARILSIGQEWDTEKSACHLLVCDSSKRRISLTALNEAATLTAPLAIDDVIICKPDSFDPVGLRATCTKRESIAKVRSERKDIPYSISLFSEIDKAPSASISSLDVMTLSPPSSGEIQTKDGLVRRSELSIGDPTGEIKIYAWRGLSKFFDRISTGSRVKFQAVEIQSHEGKKFAVFKRYSRISPSGYESRNDLK